MTNEELEKEVKRLEQQLTELRSKILESKAEKKPYEVEIPEGIVDYYVNELDGINSVFDTFFKCDYKSVYQRGLAFKTKEQAEQHDKERILLFKMHKWAEEHNGEWEHKLGSFNYRACIILRNDLCSERGFCLDINENSYFDPFSKLPYFKSEELAEQFIEEFGEEIKEVLC